MLCVVRVRESWMGGPLLAGWSGGQPQASITLASEGLTPWGEELPLGARSGSTSAHTRAPVLLWTRPRTLVVQSLDWWHSDTAVAGIPRTWGLGLSWNA